MAKEVILKDKDNNNAYPRTFTSAIYDENTGERLDNTIDTIEQFMSDREITPIANGGTGKRTAVEAFEALDFRGIYRNSTDDYNNLTETGTYLVTRSALNTPDTNNALWYYLKVKRYTIDLTVMIIQECMAIGTDSEKILKYHRTKYGNNNWTSWRKNYTSDDELFIDRGHGAQFTSKKLSDAMTIGSYFITTLSEFTDKPTVDSSYNYGVLTVSKSIGYVTQTLVLTIANTTKLKVFERFVNINNPTSHITTGWREIFTNESVIPIANGGTGATTAAGACNNIGALKRIAPDGDETKIFTNPTSDQWGWCCVGVPTGECATYKTPMYMLYGVDCNQWYNVLTFGSQNRLTQIAIQAYQGTFQNRIFIRSRHVDNNDMTQWQNWKEIFGTYSTVPVANGGTGATTAANALKNLGITSGTTDLTPGSSALATGAIYLVYE